MKKKFKVLRCKFQDKGFTLIELTVLMAIFIIISGMLFLNFREGERNLALQRSAHIVTQTISKAIGNSFAGKQHNGTVSPGGFGVVLEQNSQNIIIFADCDADNTFDASGVAISCGEATIDTPYTEQFSVEVLESDILVSTLNPCSGTPCRLILTFIPPNPDVVFEPGLAVSEAQIGLRDTKGNTINIFVNKLGVTRIQQ